MRNRKIIAMTLIASLFSASAAHAYCVECPPVIGGGSSGGGGAGAAGPLLACIFGGAFGLITASLAKGQAYNNDKIELTQAQANAIILTCGAGAIPIIASFRIRN